MRRDRSICNLYRGLEIVKINQLWRARLGSGSLHLGTVYSSKTGYLMKQVVSANGPLWAVA